MPCFFRALKQRLSTIKLLFDQEKVTMTNKKREDDKRRWWQCQEARQHCHLHFEVVESIVVFGEERQSPDTGEEEWDAAL